MKLPRYSRFKFGLVLGIGALVASVLCVQCVRTYLYTDAVLVPQQAEREAERQGGVLTAAARSAGITDPRSLGPAIQHALESSTDHVLWVRVLDLKNSVLAQGGNPQGRATVSPQWWASVEKHESLGRSVDTPEGKAFVVMLPFRLPRPPQFQEAATGRPELPSHLPGARRPTTYVLEVAISLKTVAGAFEGLRQNLIVGLIASIALFVSTTVIGLRAPHYFRGRYLESELQLARRVQSDLQPKPKPVSPHVEFGASAVAADHVGGDFHDIFEAESGSIAIVLGDVSGKGVPAALLGSVLQGAIRSSSVSNHEFACERINRMLCERTAGERFATLFWGVFDPATSTLSYVNAGHAAPMLVRSGQKIIERLDEGGPVLGLLPKARYLAGTVKIESSDMLVLYSDGINEATNQNSQEYGEDRITELISDAADATASEMCGRIMKDFTAFAKFGVSQDDRTLMVVRFPEGPTIRQRWNSGTLRVGAVA
ncbi:MAG: PP2C family protein-serine/threonine phosphatase [Bryobacteraceae bacterium]